MKVKVNVYLKNGILDPQGKAVHHALDVMDFKSLKDVRIGKQIILDINADSQESAKIEATNMAKKLLVNQVTEDFDIEFIS